MNRLHRQAPISRAALADVTGLNKSTVSSLVTELIERRFVREVGIISTGIGRPSVLIELNPQAGFIISAELGVGFISVVCANFTADVLWECRESFSLNAGHAATLDRALALIAQAIDAGQHATGQEAVLGIAIGVPGLVEMRTGTLLFAPNLHWQHVPIRRVVQKAYPNVPIFVDNEANFAGLGEYFFGAAQDYHNILFLSAGVGLGGAIMHEGRLMRGTTGFAGEFGHMTMDPHGEPCNCGNRGCWETQVSQSAVFRHVQGSISGGEHSLLQALRGDLTMQAVVEAARAGDAVALHALNRVGNALGIGTAALVNVLNPDLVLVGGIISLAGEFIMPIVRAELHARALRWSAHAVTILPAQHGSQACVMGGVATVYQAILSQPGTSPISPL